MRPMRRTNGPVRASGPMRCAPRPTRCATRPMRRCSSARSVRRRMRRCNLDRSVRRRMRRCNLDRSVRRPTRRCNSAWSASRSASRPMRLCRSTWSDQLADATIQFRVVSEPTDATDDLADANGYLGQAELRALVRSILADLKPREREVIELSFRHDLDDNDLAIVLGVSWSRAHALASRARGRLEKSFGALAHRACRAGGLPGGRGIAGRLGWTADRADARPGRLAHRAVPDLRQSRTGRAAPDGSFRPAAAGPAPSGTAGAGLEPAAPPRTRMRWLTADGWSGARNRHGWQCSRRRSGG